MKQVTRIEMANSDHIFEITYGGEIKTESTRGKGFNVLIGNHVINWCQNEESSNQFANTLIVNDDLILTGYGVYSGFKFWQLPSKMKTKIWCLAIKQK